MTPQVSSLETAEPGRRQGPGTTGHRQGGVYREAPAPLVDVAIISRRGQEHRQPGPLTGELPGTFETVTDVIFYGPAAVTRLRALTAIGTDAAVIFRN